ncbi:hypothetical protein [Yeosuana marina]|uniref:hypothetical protein n=1 Tax=Yeosuana marina TaxID=1565536 RepID=UPI0030C84CED
MNLNKIVIVAFATILFTSCNNKDNNNKATKIEDDIVKTETIDEVPRLSDEDFDKAIKAYAANDKAEASAQIQKGILALKAEGANINGLSKVNLDYAIDELTNIAGRLDSNEDISTEGLKEAIVNAELNINHEYLSGTEDVYMLVKPANVSSAKTKRNFSGMIANLKKEEASLDQNSKKDRDRLLKEGESLEKELKAWETKAKAYSKKTNDHFKTYSPQYYKNSTDF